jgi:hypothetical protein
MYENKLSEIHGSNTTVLYKTEVESKKEREERRYEVPRKERKYRR